MPSTRKSPSAFRRKLCANAARAMRHQPTPAEEAIWQLVRNRQIAGLKFRRQHAIDRFVVDFYCADAHLVIEIDGSSHRSPNDDAERQEILEALGLCVLRFTNEEALHDPDGVRRRIERTLNVDPTNA
jgi:very-short-patch-repair endonuclease